MLGGQYALYGSPNLRANGGILSREIELRNRFNSSVALWMRAHSLSKVCLSVLQYTRATGAAAFVAR